MKKAYRTKLRLMVAVGAIAVVSALLALTPRTSATGISSVVEKSKLETVYQCYSSGQMTSPLTSNDWPWDGMFGMVQFGSTYPVLNDNGMGAKYLSCGELFRDYYANKFPNESASVSTLDTFFRNMGYTINADASTGRCATYNFKNEDGETSYVQMCAADVQNGTIQSDKMEITYSDGIAEVVGFDSKNGKVELDCNIGYWITNIGKGGCQTHKFSDYNNSFDQFANGIFQDINNAIARASGSISRGDWSLDGDIQFSSYGDSNKTYTINSNATTAANAAINYLSGGNYKNRRALALSTTEKQDLLLNYIRNYYGINYYLGSENSACNLTGKALERAKGTSEFTQVNLSSSKTCFITAVNNRNDYVPTYNSSSYPDGTTMNFSQIIAELNNLIEIGEQDAKAKCTNAADRVRRRAEELVDKAIMGHTSQEVGDRAQATINSLDKIKQDYGQYWYEENGTIMCYEYVGLDGNTSSNDPDYTPPTLDDLDTPDNGGNNSTEDDSELAACYDGTGVLGWIVCPVIELVGNATTFLYNEFIEPSLQIQAEKIMSRDEGIYTGWTAFRDFANIAFVIFFAVIILSQLTGIGLSNYNIKKILPRFIMVVVLVNLSFVICQLAVDVSNLLGVGLRNLFTTLPLPAGQERVGAGDIAGSIVSFLGLAVASGFVIKAVGISALVSSIGFWIVPILISLLGCLISVLFFFIILGARQAGIVILVVLAPVAIVCYALPNTKSFFDRWRKLFTALLMVYPIAGLLMGGGEYAGALIMSLNKDGDLGFFYTLTGMLITVVPFFLIPSLLKSSMAMMGNLGMKLSNLGSRVRGGATGAIRHTRAFQESQAEKQRKMNLARDTRTVRRLDARAERHGGKLSDSAKLRRARAMSNAERALGEYATADALTGRDLMTRGDDRYAAMVQRTKDKSIEESASALTTVWQNDGTSGDFKKLSAVASEAAAKLRTNFNDQGARAQLLAAQKLLETSDDGRAALSSVMNDFELNGGGDVEGTNQVLRWMADAAMSRNASLIKRSSPALAAQLNRILQRENNSAPLSDRSKIRRDSKGAYYNIDDLKGRISSLSAGQMPDVDEADLDRFIAAMESKEIAQGSTEYNRLVTQARKALTDPRISANVKDKVGAKLQQIANMDHTLAAKGDAQTVGSGGIARAQATAAMAGSSLADLNRIQEGMKGETISGDTRNDMLNTMEQTMRNAMAGHVDISTENAKKIHEILTENGRNVLSASATESDKQKYNSLMAGLKVEHTPRPKLSEVHADWSRATQDGAGYKAGDWISGSEISGQTRKLTAAEVAEAEILLRREAAENIRKHDAEHADRQNDNGGENA